MSRRGENISHRHDAPRERHSKYISNSEDFVEHFREWFVHISARREMHDKFLRLVQGDKSLIKIYNLIQICTAADYNSRREMQPLVPFGFKVYTILVERARRVEIDFQIT
ncbi:hypothetical protein IEQ34_004374 [Dendrobium chrysotoxum]|uniref:Uncharacterized protein n=1 Tax=Dendrobium chrysotoxum TaxID=161865 RepID=A0AAV7HEX5_DENCH|nr:hypothetical protein IEQ34_004374 [Dendrobium chrysotoxum]